MENKQDKIARWLELVDSVMTRVSEIAELADRIHIWSEKKWFFWEHLDVSITFRDPKITEDEKTPKKRERITFKKQATEV